MNTEKYVALYCRISKRNGIPDESNSIANQKRLLQKAAIQHGFENTKFYIDDGYSGTDGNRTALKELEAAICADQISAVLVKDTSRLSRDYLKVGYYLEDLFPKHHVRFIAISGGIDSDTNSVDFLPFYSIMDEWYAKDISRKVRLMYQSRAIAGIPIGKPIYGYRKSKDNPNIWALDGITSVVVQRIYRLSYQGCGTEQIAKALEKAEILTPSQHAVLQAENLQHNVAPNPYRWSSTTVAKILRDQRYCGDVVNLKTYSNSYKDKKRRSNPQEKYIIFHNVHEPIVDRTFWQYIQHKLNTQKNRKRIGKQSLFSGFLRCGDCGSNLHYHFNQKNPSIEYYNCSNYVGNRGSCPDTHYIRLDDLTTTVLYELNALISAGKRSVFWDKVSEKRSKQADRESDALIQDCARIKERLNDLSSILRNSYEDKLKGVIDEETFMLLTNDFKRERDELRHQEKTKKRQLDVVQKYEYGIGLFREFVEKQTPLTAIDRDIVGEFIDYIAVHPANRTVKPYTQKTEIHYHFIGKILDYNEIVLSPIP